MKNLICIISFLVISSTTYARKQRIGVGRSHFPIYAVDALNLLQSDLARRAKDVCGGSDKVISLSDIQISIKGYDPNLPLAVLLQDEVGLELRYPETDAEATLECLD